MFYPLIPSGQTNLSPRRRHIVSFEIRRQGFMTVRVVLHQAQHKLHKQRIISEPPFRMLSNIIWHIIVSPALLFERVLYFEWNEMRSRRWHANPASRVGCLLAFGAKTILPLWPWSSPFCVLAMIRKFRTERHFAQMHFTFKLHHAKHEMALFVHDFLHWCSHGPTEKYDLPSPCRPHVNAQSSAKHDDIRSSITQANDGIAISRAIDGSNQLSFHYFINIAAHRIDRNSFG